MRLFILSDSPPEKDVQWSDQGMLASYKFVQKLYLLNEKINKIMKKEKKDDSSELSKYINQYLSKIEKNLSNFNYNVIIANIHEAYSFLYKITNSEIFFSNLKDEYSKFLISIIPVMPHLANECLEKLSINTSSWPTLDKKYLIEDIVAVVVQFNGKKRGIIEVKKDTAEKDLIYNIKKSKAFEKFLKNNKIKKYFYVKNRLINILI